MGKAPIGPAARATPHEGPIQFRPPHRTRALPARVPEPFVWWLWEQRRAGSAVQATDGRIVRVIYPGRRWGSWGPDFRGALLAIDEVLVRGDVEVHVRAGDWAAHGHTGDPEYAGTVLHVLFEEPSLPAGAPDIATVALAPLLREPLGMLLAEWQAGPPESVQPDPCRSLEEASELLARAGLARLEARAVRFEGDLASQCPTVVLLTGAIESLGYVANVAPMRRLLERAPVAHLLDLAATEGALAVAAVLFSEAGLLPSQRGRLPLDAYTLDLEAHSAESPMAVRPAEWRWRGCRPANTPVRRVAAAAALLAEGGEHLAEHSIVALLELPPRRACTALRALWARPGDGYWQEHADLGRPLARRAALIGEQRAADIVVNVLLPWALALGRSSGNVALEQAALAAYRTHPPLADNQITRHMARQIVGASGSRVLRSACLQQGLIQIYQGWCDARDCAHCPAGSQGALALGVRPLRAAW